MSAPRPAPYEPRDPQEASGNGEQPQFGAPSSTQGSPYGQPPAPQPPAPLPNQASSGGTYSQTGPTGAQYPYGEGAPNSAATQSPYAPNSPNSGVPGPTPYAQSSYGQPQGAPQGEGTYTQGYGAGPNPQQTYVQETYSQDTYGQGGYGAAQNPQQTYVQETYTQGNYGSSVELQAFQQTGPIPNQKSKLTAGLLSIFLGVFGVGNFYLGNTAQAVMQLVLGVTAVGAPISALWGLVDGILILTASPGSKYSFDAAGVPLGE